MLGNNRRTRVQNQIQSRRRRFDFYPASGTFASREGATVTRFNLIDEGAK